MIDFDTAVQTALSPIVTIPVIAALTLVLGGTIYDSHRRLRNAAADNAKKTLKVVGLVIRAAEKEMARRSADAIEFTYDSLKNIGWDKLARGDVSMDDVIFGAMPRTFGKPMPRAFGKRRPTFSMDELKEALRPGEDAAGLEGNGGSPRPYHTAAMSGEPSFSNPSPRAG